MDDQAIVWHPEVITGAVVEALQGLQRASVLESFYLAGGTGLVLRFGHRLSRALDFFSGAPFAEDMLTAVCQRVGDSSVTGKARLCTVSSATSKSAS
jgi:hypothetical protein